MFFTRNNSQEKICSVVIVTLSGVYGAAVKFFSHPQAVQAPVVLFSVFKKNFFRGMTESQLQEQSFIHTEKILAEIASRGIICDEHVCILGSWASDLEVRKIHYHSDRVTTIQEKMIHDLVSRDLKKFQEDVHYQEKFSGQGIIDASPLFIDINGYRINSFLSQQARTVDITYMIGLVPTFIITRMVQIYEKIFHTNKIHLSLVDYIVPLGITANNWESQGVLTIDGVNSFYYHLERGIPVLREEIHEGFASIAIKLSELFELYEKHIDHIFELTQKDHILDEQRTVFNDRILKACSVLIKKIEKKYNEVISKVSNISREIMVLGVPHSAKIIEMLILNHLKKNNVHFSRDEQVILSHDANISDALLLLGIKEVQRLIQRF